MPEYAEEENPISPSTGAQITPAQFIQRWAGRPLTERAAAQSHFVDLCRLLNVATPTDNRVNDSNYGFEARTDLSASNVETRLDDGLPFYQVVTGTGSGFADVWMRDHFAWEYKRQGKYATLGAALAQLRIYAPSLGNPPLLIVSDIDRIEIHTNFTNYPPTTFAFHITELVNPSDAWRTAHPTISPLEALRKVFDDPRFFRPARTRQAITATLANDIGDLAKALRDAGNEPHAVAHFLMQVVFCFFAEDIGLLPRDIFTNLIAKSLDDAPNFPAKARALFKAMELGGIFGSDTIQWFNGGLYANIDADPAIRIAPAWLGKLLMVARADWNAVDPTIFGTLFERSLDPDKRSQIGAHYTSREDILLIVEPVIMQPLRRQWQQVQQQVAQWLDQRREEKQSAVKQRNLSKKIEKTLTDFADHLGSITILDPACGSGNFLFVTIQQLLDLENEVRAFAGQPEIAVTFTQRVQPRQLRGIDVNDYACELARISIWIGYLQWLHANGTTSRTPPILDPLDTIEHRDAILAWADENDQPIPVWRAGAKCLGAAQWPEADFIVGNPPFLGMRVVRKSGMPEEYIQATHNEFDLPNSSDLCCYWFEVGRRAICTQPKTRLGLLATQQIRKGANNWVIERIAEEATIFMAWSDHDWILEGAAVHVSIIGFTGEVESQRILNGIQVGEINADLTSGLNTNNAEALRENRVIAFRGIEKGGAFDVDWETARDWLSCPNPNSLSNVEVLRPYCNGMDINRRSRALWLIDFADKDHKDAACYEAPFSFVERVVKPKRQRNRRADLRENWWLPRSYPIGLLNAISKLRRYPACCNTFKHWVLAWIPCGVVTDSCTTAFAREDDYFFGLVQSTVHELWLRRVGIQLRESQSGSRYTPTTCFETFPLPWPPGQEPVEDARYKAIAAAAKELNTLRERWLNPPEWLKPIEEAVDRFEDFSDVPPEARPLLRHSAIMARAAKDKRLKARTLTNLYNERPAWLKLAHRALDEAVIAAYAHVDPAGAWDTAWAAAYEPFGAGEISIVEKGKRKDDAPTVAAKQAAIEARKTVDEAILSNLLRLNQQRAGGS